MPLFDFQCTKCGQTSELLVRSTNTPQCPKCGSSEMNKLVSKPAAPGTSKSLVDSARARAKAEGHFSHY